MRLETEEHVVHRADLRRIVGGVRMCGEITTGAQYAYPVRPQRRQVRPAGDQMDVHSGPAQRGADIGQALRGQQVFLGSTCVMCHNITGTKASAQRAPDLTHLAGRRTLAGGALPNDPQHLASWISNPAAHKPGANMPAHAFSKEDLQALVGYLGSLQ